MSWIWDNLLSKKKERKSFVIFLSWIIFMIFIKLFISYVFKPHYPDLNEELFAEVTKIEEEYRTEKQQKKQSYSTDKNQSNNKEKRKAPKKQAQNTDLSIGNTAIKVEQLFPFNPNKIGLDSLLLLGISKYAANNLIRYREKGGKIYSKEKFKTIYGIDEDTYIRVKNFIDIPPRYTNNSKQDTFARKEPYKKKPYKKKAPPKPIEINSADTLAWRSLPGIGPVYSRRIVNFREKLGGFFTIDQVGDCYGLPDSVFTSILPYLKLDPSKIKKFNINTVDKEAFVMHPYIDWKAAKVILSYREMHGDFQDIKKLYDLYGIEKSLIDTIVIYFDVE